LGNREELAAFVGNAFDTTPVEVERHFQETEKDPELNERLQELLKRRNDRKRTPLFGRRLGWYAIARVLIWESRTASFVNSRRGISIQAPGSAWVS